MKFFSALASAATLASTVLADSSVKLTAVSNDPSVNNLHIGAFHEGAGFNTLFLSDNTDGLITDLKYNVKSQYLYDSVSENQQYIVQLNPDNHVVELDSPALGSTILAEIGSDGYVTLNGKTTFTAQKNVGDRGAYTYSKDHYAWILDPKEGTEGSPQFKVKAESA